MNTHSPTFRIKRFRWASELGGPKEHGIRIDRARGWIFVPDREIYSLAETLINYMESNR